MYARFIILAAFIVVMAGCGDSYGGRLEITGTIIYKGEPVEDGIVDFEPMEGQGSKDGAQIQKGGSYRIPREKGLTPGKYKVSIYIGDGWDASGEAGPEGPKKRPGSGKQGIERAPPEFNTKSTQIVEVKADGPNKFDFKIP